MEYPQGRIGICRVGDAAHASLAPPFVANAWAHVMGWNQRSLRRILQSYFAYHQHSRTHLALDQDTPEPRAVEPAERGRVLAIPQVGGLHHRYQRCAA